MFNDQIASSFLLLLLDLLHLLLNHLLLHLHCEILDIVDVLHQILKSKVLSLEELIDLLFVCCHPLL